MKKRILFSLLTIFIVFSLTIPNLIFAIEKEGEWETIFQYPENNHEAYPTEDYYFLSTFDNIGNDMVKIGKTNLTDLTEINTLFVVWENTGDDDIQNISQMGYHGVCGSSFVSVRTEKTGKFSKTTSSLDVSGVTGNQCLGIVLRDQNGEEIINADLKVYAVYDDNGNYYLGSSNGIPEILPISTSFVSSTLPYIQETFGDFSGLIALIIGLPVGFYVIKRIIGVVKYKIR